MDAYVTFLKACMLSLDDVLAGKKTSTEVMFPSGTMNLVEGIYTNNLFSDYFNNLVAKSVSSTIQKLKEIDPGRTINILEIGAGTGATTKVVLNELGKSLEKVQYYYTDLSDWFLEFGKNKFRDYPYIKYFEANLEKELLGHGLNQGAMNIVIGTNVLHATSNVRKSLRNIKEVLHEQGVLIINEITSFSLFSSLTFGLTDGWWLYEDEDIRIKNAPVLNLTKWKEILESEGFHYLNSYSEKGSNVERSLQSVIYATCGMKQDTIPISKDHVETRSKVEIDSQDIAIVGLAGKYPGADTVSEFWNVIETGENCIQEVPPDRWDYHRVFEIDKTSASKTFYKWGGFLKMLINLIPFSSKKPELKLWSKTFFCARVCLWFFNLQNHCMVLLYFVHHL
jgi:ubiquinone/menaquinone biosynthesis C-methylase UbiE